MHKTSNSGYIKINISNDEVGKIRLISQFENEDTLKIISACKKFLEEVVSKDGNKAVSLSMNKERVRK